MAKRVDPDARKRVIAEKAMKLFSQVGYDNVTLMMIAYEAKIARTVLYRHFRSKREVLDAAIRGNTRYIMAEVDRIRSGRGSVAERLARIGERVIGVLFEKRDFLVAIFDFVLSMSREGEDMGARVLAFTPGIRSAFRELLERGIAEGEFAASAEIGDVADGLFSQFESTALRIVLGIESAPDAACRRFRESVKALSGG